MCGIFSIIGDTEIFNETYFSKGAKRGPEFSCVRYFNKEILFGFHRLNDYKWFKC